MAKTRQSSIRRSAILGSFAANAAGAKCSPTHLALTSKNARRAVRSARGLGALLGLILTGCPTGADLDTSHEAYLPTPTTGVKPSSVSSSGDTSSTTAGNEPCDDSTVDGALYYWCSSSSCHGDVDENNGDAPLWLFSPTRGTDFLNLPATEEGCSDELIVDTANPEASLLLTAIRHTSPCGVAMPDGGIRLTKPEDQACIEEWVLGLAAAGAGN